MSCGCTSFVCLGVVSNDCDSLVMDITANETATWIMKYEFNNRWFDRDIAVINAQPLTLPNVFNEQYEHQIKFYNSDNELVNDTCYTLDTSQIGSYSPTSTPGTSSNRLDIINITVHAGNSFTLNSDYSGWSVMLINANDTDYNINNYDQVGLTTTMTNLLTFDEGQIITVTLKKNS